MKKRCNCHDWTRIDSFCCPVHGIQNWFRQGDKMTYRERLLKIARKQKLGDLAKQVLHRSYTPGIEDEVLIERCVEADKNAYEHVLKTDNMHSAMKDHMSFVKNVLK